MAATSLDRRNEWLNHAAHQRTIIATLPARIRTAAAEFDVPKVRQLAYELIDACDEYQRTTKPIAEWEAIVKEEQGA